MFNFLSSEEKWVLLVGPLLLLLLILFQGWQANHWHAEMVKEEQLKAKWQASYMALNEHVQQFAEQQKQLTQAVNALKHQQTQQTQDLKNALKQHQTWADSPIPDSVRGVLNGSANH
ncbi:MULTISPECIES: chemotaxis protein [Rodentibacter]|uniref:Chemotaxis protein n=1 Tax=Rodentibacter pneumotropicus TaxID=758 RepID=A0A4V6RIG1_9PAST|nr:MULTISPECIES: chemotaxis protein [Pasteurellaceae]TGY50832.1 chemotaxis protein [Pasteurella caecimuris]TGZ98526.1 chemotaxis protein [Rodentibacter pneumotropicus]THA00941.1 chemotaxis protein [Rodentibacter pneumotropicus]THA05100.1 chemotaxis protein [Rodentibacter pneumotropicus]THA08199.1 chemotaxis protein [Rodentibacter pneumotropicus]